MNIAFLGTGILGYSMAEKLLEGGYHVWVYNRTLKKAEGLKDQGAMLCKNAADALKQCAVVILVLSDNNAIESVLFKDENEFNGKTVIQMGTISSEQSLNLKKRIESLQGHYFECPVLGSKNEARAAELILMVGANEKQFAQFQGLLKSFGPQPRLVGPVGSAATLKLALNHLIASHAVCFSLSLGLIENSGIDVDLFMSILKDSALNAPMYSKKLSNWIKRDYQNPNFPLKHLIKDVDLILNEAYEKRLNTKTLSAIRGILALSEQDGLAELDYSAVYETINKK